MIDSLIDFVKPHAGVDLLKASYWLYVEGKGAADKLMTEELCRLSLDDLISFDDLPIE
jgi:hypothetical protein